MTESLDRERIEAFLEREMDSIVAWCRYRLIPRDAWPQEPAARGWLDLAIGRAADLALTTGRAHSHTAALRLVCGAFGLDGDSIARRWRRGRARRKENGRNVRPARVSSG